MRILSSALAAMAMFTFATTSAWAEPSPKQMQLAKRYFEVARMDALMKQSVDAWTPTVADTLIKSYPEMPEQQRRLILADLTEVAQAYLVKMTERMLPIVAETYTEQELRDLIAFCESPAGQALIVKQPALTARMAELMSRTMPDYNRELRVRWCAKLTCAPTEKSQQP